LIYQST